MNNLTDLDKLKLVYYLLYGSLLALAVFLALYMLLLHRQDSRRAKQISEQLNLDAGDGL